MAELFGVVTLALVCTLLGKRGAAILCLLAALSLALLVFWHHATDILKINW